MTHELVEQLPADHPLSESNVKTWIKYNKEHLKSIRSYADSKESKLRQEYQVVNNYINNLQAYLNNGIYLDHRWGLKGDKKMLGVCYAKAYDKEGNIKRTKNTWYDDIGWYETEGEHVDPISDES